MAEVRKYDSSKNPTKRKKVSFTIRKGLQNLISWKQLYTTKGTKNKAMATIADEQIDAYKSNHGLD